MTNYTPAQLEAWAGLGPLTIHHGANSHCFEGRVLVNDDDSRCIAFVEGYEVSDADGFAVGIEPTEEAKALAAAPDLARLVLEKEKEIAELKRLLAQASDAIEGRTDDLDERICCNGHQCGCMGATNRSFLLYHIRQAMKETSDE